MSRLDLDALDVDVLHFPGSRDALHADGTKQSKTNFRYVLASLKLLLRPVFFQRVVRFLRVHVINKVLQLRFLHKRMIPRSLTKLHPSRIMAPSR